MQIAHHYPDIGIDLQGMGRNVNLFEEEEEEEEDEEKEKEEQQEKKGGEKGDTSLLSP